MDGRAWPEILKWSREHGAIGFGELKPGNDLTIDDPACMALFEDCHEVGFPVLFHLDAENCIDDPGLPRLEGVLKSFPDLSFIAHGPGWWRSISGDVTSREDLNGYPDEAAPVTPGGAAPRLLEDYPNLYADLSARSGLLAISRDMNHGLAFLDQFQDKLLFGTDTVPVIGDWGHFEFYGELTLSTAVESKIYRENAQRLLALPEPFTDGDIAQHPDRQGDLR